MIQLLVPVIRPVQIDANATETDNDPGHDRECEVREWNVSTTSVRAIMAALAVLPVVAAAALPGSNGVEIVRKDADHRIDVIIDGQPFTSYLWPASVKKPVLFPIRSAKGTIVTRGVPLEPRPGERMDHPHHVGLWFNFGDVNGFDFWGNSDAIPEKDRGKEGTIVQRAIVSATGGAKDGEITADSDWVLPDKSVLLTDRTIYRFSGTSSSRTIDLDITLTAQGTRAVFNDTKEGMLGLRVARSLEAPSTEPEIFTDAAGHPTTVPKLDNTGVTGSYLTSAGKAGDAAWGTRGKWCLLAGTVNEEPSRLPSSIIRAIPGIRRSGTRGATVSLPQIPSDRRRLPKGRWRP